MNWDIGEMLTKSQKADGWGQKTLQRLAVDLKNEYPERKGFSVRNMQCMMQFYNEYNKELTMVKVGNIPITQSMIAQLGNAPIELPIKRFVIYKSLLVYPTMNQVKLCRKIFAVAFLPLKKSKRDSTNGIKNNIQQAALNSGSRLFFLYPIPTFSSKTLEVTRKSHQAIYKAFALTGCLADCQYTQGDALGQEFLPFQSVQSLFAKLEYITFEV